MDFKKALFDNPKTTVAGIVSALGYFLPLVGVPLSPAIANGIIAIGVALVGIFAGDGGKA